MHRRFNGPKLLPLAYRTAYVLAVLWFLVVCVQFYMQGKGFTYLIVFGNKAMTKCVPELRNADFYSEDNYGYDGQYYAEIAVHPKLDRTLRESVDSLTYRARRILFAWTAYIGGAGQPAAVLNFYALQNILCWLLLAWVLLRWFPPNGFQNLIRWLAVMFSYGMIFSVRRALLDGPSLLLITIAIAWFEARRSWWSAAMIGVASLGKETNALAVTMFWPRERREWSHTLLKVALAAAPLCAWIVYLQLHLGHAADAGARNFDWPLIGYARRWSGMLTLLHDPATQAAGVDEIIVLITLAIQLIALLFIWRPDDAWWRVGLSYGVLMLVLGDAVWDGATVRVVLPLTVAFNILVPRRSFWWFLVLIAGNAAVALSPDLMQPAPRPDYTITGPQYLQYSAQQQAPVTIEFHSHWYPPERSRLEVWRWASATADVLIHNPHPFALTATMTLRLRSADDRSVTIQTNSRELWHGQLTANNPSSTTLPLRLPPGDTRLSFDTDAPGMKPTPGDLRTVAFSVRNLRLQLTGREP